MSKIQFTDNSVKVKSALNDAVIAYLYEAAGELETQTKRNTTQNRKYGNIQAPNLWKYNVDESNKEAKVGSPYEAGYWEELGTGEWAINKDGRKGWWVYVEGNTSPQANQKYYTEKEAKGIAAGMRAQGLDAHATNGHEAKRPLYTAYTTNKSALIQRAEEVLGARMK